MKNEIKIGFCVAYDWHFLQYALPPVYEAADIICLSIDKDRISWAGNKFEFDESGFRKMLQAIDKGNKIRLYEDNFHLAELTPMQNEVRQRNKIADFMGKESGWHIQLDSDEYFIDFRGFSTYLRKLRSRRPVNVCCPWITMYKQVEQGFLIVETETIEKVEFIPVATNSPHYEHGRRNAYFNHYANFPILHQSWARSEAEVELKVNNWGHKTDFDVRSYLKFWKDLDGNNYTSARNFHPIVPGEWHQLKLIKAGNTSLLIQEIKRLGLNSVSGINFRRKNSLWLSRFKKMMRIISPS